MELLKILNENGQETGQILDKIIVHKNGLWHKEIAIWIFNHKGEVLIQKRSPNKIIAPNKWALCAGHVPADEDSITSAQRELFEEVGLKKNKKDFHFLTTQKKERIFSPDAINKIFNKVYYVITDQKISEFKIQTEELTQIKWINYNKLKNKISNQDEDITLTLIPENIKMFDLLDRIYSKITHNESIF
jgi:isopentenyldiphosphate isomerase